MQYNSYMKTAIENNKSEIKINPEVTKLIKKLSKKYQKVWQDLAKI